MTKKELYKQCFAILEAEIPNPQTELEYGSVFQLLVAVMLSAQCTDKRVNTVTPALYRAYPDALSMSAASTADLLEYISSISYPNAKADHLCQMSRMLVQEYGGQVPTHFEDLIKLPGVGRKTANVIEAVAYGNGAMPVDTHVFRVSHRIGLVSDRHTTPLSVEKELVKHIPQNFLGTAHHLLLLHGRYTCTARTPGCSGCALGSICHHYQMSSPSGLAKTLLGTSSI
ncbi:MAG: endonuclease III [Bacteroidaceae bacterium]|nr:endonuclease III [Bacteroidaceae bacterium]